LTHLWLNMTDTVHDLHVTPTSNALLGKRVDLVISGSIAAVESVRFIRSLRRLGADVTVWLSQGGAQFITPMAVAWAAGKDPVLGFAGSTSHIASGDCVVVAPASSNILAKIARGMTDTHCTALIASALGQQKPVMLLPAMHDSLRAAPAMQEHLQKICSWPNVHRFNAREEEGKQKFPEPDVLADHVAHIINSGTRPNQPVLLTMGTTRGYIDDVRYISNYSSGKLGSMIGEELFRQGFQTLIVCGPCENKPRTASSLRLVTTTAEMLRECKTAESSGLCGGIFCASVLDYEPSEKTLGKLKSGHDNLTITFKPTPKIIDQVTIKSGAKIGFKLEVGLSEARAKTLADEYISKYKLTALIANELTAVSDRDHKATAFLAETATERPRNLSSKSDIAVFIANLIETHARVDRSKS